MLYWVLINLEVLAMKYTRTKSRKRLLSMYMWISFTYMLRISWVLMSQNGVRFRPK